MNILYVNTDKKWYENDVINKVFPGSDRGNYIKKFKFEFCRMIWYTSKNLVHENL